jgi:manganese-dependent inorganic pyrophosphatase
MVVGDPNANFEHGKVVVAAANPDVRENYIESNDCVSWVTAMSPS